MALAGGSARKEVIPATKLKVATGILQWLVEFASLESHSVMNATVSIETKSRDVPGNSSVLSGMLFNNLCYALARHAEMARNL